jgi:hypothetical protein
MKKVVWILVLGAFFLGTPWLSEAASECSGTFQVNDPACWTQTTTECVWTCVMVYDDNDNNNDDYSCTDSCTGDTVCSNASPTNYTITSDTCHYISSYTYGSCINHLRSANGATWATTSGISCSNAVQEESWCNSAPSIPNLGGPTAGHINTNYEFAASNAVDPDNDKISYGFDFDSDNNVDLWMPVSGYIPSGNSQFVTKQWDVAGSKTLKVKACDETGGGYINCSSWSSTHTIVLHDPVCTGNDPPADHSNLCSGSDSGLTVDVIRRLFSSCGTDKCAYICDPGSADCGGVTYKYNYNGGNPKCDECERNCDCAENTCAGSTCSDGCGGIVDGKKDCRNTNWREVSPE